MDPQTPNDKRAVLLRLLKEKTEGLFPLSSAQEQLWIADQIAGGSPEYNEPLVVRIHGSLNLDAFERAIEDLVKRHGLLRSHILNLEGRPWLVANAKSDIRFRKIDLTARGARERDAELMSEISAEAFRPFDFAHEPLWRASLVAIGIDDHVLVFSMHHIVTDERSRGILVHDLLTLYHMRSYGDTALLAPLTSQYWDYSKRQRKWLATDEARSERNYWVKQLGSLPVLNLPCDRPRPSIPSHRGASVWCKLPPDLSFRAREFSAAERSTLFMTLLAAFELLLWRYSGQVDFPIGVPVSTRERAELDDTLGLFVNILVMRANLTGQPTLREVLSRVRQVSLAAYDHRNFPLGKLVEELQQRRDLSRQSLFQVSFLLQEAPAPYPEIPGLKIEPYPFYNPTCKFDLTVGVFDNEQLEAKWEYATDLFDRETIVQMAAHYQELLEAIIVAPDRRLNQVTFAPPSIDRTPFCYAKTSEEPASSSTLVALFEAKVSETPESPALSLGSESLSYAQLGQAANRLANHLIALGVRPETLVGICLDRSIEMVVAILGVLKAGAGYVPLDPTYPHDLIAYITEDSKAAVLISRSEWGQRLELRPGVQTVYLDRDQEEIRSANDASPVVPIYPGNVAYVLYTSGSTGKPKGVVISHDNIVRLFKATEPLFKFGRGDVWTLFHSFAFDFSVWEIWGALGYGGRLVVVPYYVSRSPEDFYRLLVQEGVTVLNQTPSAFIGLLPVDARLKGTLRLRYAIFGGEALNPQVLETWMKAHENSLPSLINMYGITETTVHVTHRRITTEDLHPTAGSAIGCPLPDLQVVLLDADGNPVPRGAPGEIYVTGPGLARGYHGKPDLTAKRFLPNPFGKTGGDRMYRTGDRARLTANGDLEFLGRLDNQIKIRGFRIEKGEIEAVLAQHPGIRQAVVNDWRDKHGDMRLVAYVVPRSGSQPAGADTYQLPNGLVVAQSNKNETEFLYNEIFTQNSYLAHGIELSEDACVLDVGANIGLFSIYVAETCPLAVCYAFEPIPAVFDKLVRNVLRYNGRVKAFQLGIGAIDDNLSFTYYPRYSMMSGVAAYADSSQANSMVKQFLRNQEALGNAEAKELRSHEDELLTGRFLGQAVQCRVRPLSQIIRELGLQEIDLLKIDVEGAEEDVLAGIDAMHWEKINQVVLEVHGSDHLEQCLRILSNNGFETHVEQDPSLTSTGIVNLYARNSRAVFSPKMVAKAQSSPIKELQSVDETEVRRYLRAKLPDYMVPGDIFVLDSLPSTPSGKIDRNHLPQPDQIGRASRFGAVQPETALERDICRVWQEVLSVEAIGVEDNFFDAGGNSLLAIRVHSQLMQTVNKKLSVVDMFTYPTIRALAHHIEESRVVQPVSLDAEQLSKLETGKDRLESLRIRQQIGNAIEAGS